MKARITCIALACAIVFALDTVHLLGQIAVNPTIVLLTSRSRTMDVTLTNSANEQVEVALSFRYAVMRGTEAGGIYSDTNVTAEELEWSATDWLKVFPRKVAVPANGSRTIRVIASPPAGIAEREYWSSLVVTVKRASRPMAIADTVDTAGIGTASMGFNLHTTFPVNVRIGQVTTGIQIDSALLVADSSGKSHLVLEARQLGNAAFRGMFNVVVKKSDGSVFRTAERGQTILFARRCAVPLGDIPEGTYDLEFQAVSGRKGSAAEFSLPAETVTRAYRATITGAQRILVPR